MEEKVTLDDVARLSGVSRSAASRALNKRPGVRPDVRERVNSVADELGFRPNRAAKQLASGRSSVIGLVIPSADLRVDPYGAAVTHAVGRAAAARDLGLMLHLVEDEPGATVHHILRDGLIDGLLVSSVAAGTWAEDLFDTDLPIVLIGTHPTRTDIVSVEVENTESSAAAVQHLFDQGCERVGCITGPLHRADARARFDGYRLAHQRVGWAVDDELVVFGDYNRSAGAAAGPELVKRGADGVFACNDEMAVGAMWAWSWIGVRVPDDVLIAGFDGTAIGEFVEPSLTSVVQPFDLMARTAVELLDARVHGRDDLESVTLVPELIVGGSTARR